MKSFAATLVNVIYVAILMALSALIATLVFSFITALIRIALGKPVTGWIFDLLHNTQYW